MPALRPGANRFDEGSHGHVGRGAVVHEFSLGTSTRGEADVRRKVHSGLGPVQSCLFELKRDYTIWAVATCPNVVRITATGGRIGNRYGSCLSPPFERAAQRDGSGGSRMARRGRSRLSRPCVGSGPLVGLGRGLFRHPDLAEFGRRSTLGYRGLQHCVAPRTSRSSIPRRCRKPRRVRNHLEEKT